MTKLLFLMKKILLIIIVLNFIYCNNHTRFVDFKGKLVGRDYGKGEHIEFYSNGKIKEIQLNRNNTTVDTIFTFLKLDTIKALKKKFYNKFYKVKFDTLGFLESKGFLDSLHIKIGVWNYYKNNKPTVDIEYYDIDNKEFVNRIWDRGHGKNKIRFGNWYLIDTKKDTFHVGEKIRTYVFMMYSIFGKNNNNKHLYLLLPKLIKGNELKDNFSNINRIKFDTIENLGVFKEKQLGVKDEKAQHIVAFEQTFNKPGKKTIKGVLLEKLKKNDIILINKLLFKKNIYVKP